MTTKHPESSDTRCQLRFADGRRCALPAHPDGNGLCYPHAHAPHRRLRPSDLTRELLTQPGTLVPAHKIRRVLAKLPIAVAEGLFSPSEAGILTHLCNLMLRCNREARKNPFLESIAMDPRILAFLLEADPEQAPAGNPGKYANANQNEHNAQPSHPQLTAKGFRLKAFRSPPTPFLPTLARTSFNQPIFSNLQPGGWGMPPPRYRGSNPPSNEKAPQLEAAAEPFKIRERKIRADQLLMSALVSSLASMGSRKGLLVSGAPAMASFISLEADA